MADTDYEKNAPADTADIDKGNASSVDLDAMKLAEMGYTQEMARVRKFPLQGASWRSFMKRDPGCVS